MEQEIERACVHSTEVGPWSSQKWARESYSNQGCQQVLDKTTVHLRPDNQPGTEDAISNSTPLTMKSMAHHLVTASAFPA